MSEQYYCDWCVGNDITWRTIRKTQYIRSFISKPWFRDGHCLVIPIRHISSVSELNENESIEIMRELGRLGEILNTGFGTGVMQKYMPMQAENGVKMNHLHFHVFPRVENEEGLFPTPYPNEFGSFYNPDQDKVSELVKRLSI